MSFSTESTLLLQRTLKEFVALLETVDPKCKEDFHAAVRYSVLFSALRQLSL